MCENHDHCYVRMPNEENKTFEYKENQKSKKAPFVIYSDLECLLEKTNDDENKHTATVNNHTPCGYSIYTQCSFGDTKNKLDYYRGEDCIEKSTDHLKDHATSILDYEQKNLIKLTKEEYKIIKIKKFAKYATKNLLLMMKIKIITKLKIIVNLLVNTKVLVIRFVGQNIRH